ncbi:MAG: lipopolysaccharide kinase InaA family protein [Fervidicoccaceae archaeon]
MRFFSRKNIVTLEKFGEKMVVRKEFSKKNNMFREIEVLRYLEASAMASHVPRLIFAEEENKVIYLEYIRGSLLSELSPREFIEKLSMAVEWLRKLHSLGLAKGDCNPRNFILHENKMYGLDFEESRPLLLGNQEALRDLIDLMSTSILIMASKGDDPCEAAMSIVRLIPSSYGSLFVSEDEFLKLIEEFLQRRKKYRPESEALFNSVIGHLRRLRKSE